MKVAIFSTLVQFLSFSVTIGETMGQQYEARQGEAEVTGLSFQSPGTTHLQRAAQFPKDARTLNSDFDAVRSTLQETADERSSKGRTNTVRQQHHDCNNNDIAECVNLLEVLTNKDLGFAASVDELNRMCPVLLDGLQCIDNYTRRCLTLKHREYFNKLYAGTIRVIKDLCNTKGRYQQEYIRHAPCMRQVNPKYNQCSEVYHEKTADLNQLNDAVVQLSEEEKNKNVITLCCSFQEYLQCSERVVFETCGNETALFTKEFLDRMAGPIVQDLCEAYSFSLHSCLQESSTATPGNSLQASTASLAVASPRPSHGSDSSNLPGIHTLGDPERELALQSVPSKTVHSSVDHLEGHVAVLRRSAVKSYQATSGRTHVTSPTDPSTTHQPPATVTFTHGTTVRPMTSLPAPPVLHTVTDDWKVNPDGREVNLDASVDRRATGEKSETQAQSTQDDVNTETSSGSSSTFKCVKYAPGSRVCENAGSSAVVHTSLVSMVALLLSFRHLLA
ncbi:uncharacterized protein LOC121862341 [Homarus americanus]|uniref:uncharacterized protein LOC121862341 n=1 Tax=Homarus americanus TaxID=6706 RepID=UPI001C489663|nr:uncharacterized protein LOC121862341 [Homarus americanus]